MFRTFIRQYWDWLLLILLGVPALWPYTHGLPRSADGFLHIIRTALLITSTRAFSIRAGYPNS